MVPAYYAIGIRAFTSSIVNVAPDVAVKLHELASAGQGEALSQLMATMVVPSYALRARRRGYEVTVVKEMMNRVGLRGGRSRVRAAPSASEIREEMTRAANSGGGGNIRCSADNASIEDPLAGSTSEAITAWACASGTTASIRIAPSTSVGSAPATSRAIEAV